MSRALASSWHAVSVMPLKPTYQTRHPLSAACNAGWTAHASPPVREIHEPPDFGAAASRKVQREAANVVETGAGGKEEFCPR